MPTSREAQGYKYVTSHFSFRYLLKAELTPGVSFECLEKNIRDIDEHECPSFGLGRWFQPQTAKVWLHHEEPYGKKYHNEYYQGLVGSTFYAPYMSGWAMVVTADVARFLGMYGRDMPRWRNFWRIEDAAIGTYMIGLDICHVELMCDPIGEQELPSAPPTFAPTQEPAIEVLGRVLGFHGPFDDDVPGIGSLANIQVSNLQECAYRCIQNI